MLDKSESEREKSGSKSWKHEDRVRERDKEIVTRIVVGRIIR